MFQLIKMLLSCLTQEQKEGIYSKPVLWAAIEAVHAADASPEAYTRFWWEATYYGSPLQSVSMLQDLRLSTRWNKPWVQSRLLYGMPVTRVPFGSSLVCSSMP